MSVRIFLPEEPFLTQPYIPIQSHHLIPEEPFSPISAQFSIQEIGDIAMATTRSILKLKGVVFADLTHVSAFPCLARARGFCATTQTVESSAEGIRAETLPQQKLKEKSSSLSEKGRRQRSWMPDPVTGDFIPEDHFGEIDTADMRQNVLRDHSVFRGSN